MKAIHSPSGENFGNSSLPWVGGQPSGGAAVSRRGPDVATVAEGDAVTGDVREAQQLGLGLDAGGYSRMTAATSGEQNEYARIWDHDQGLLCIVGSAMHRGNRRVTRREGAPILRPEAPAKSNRQRDERAAGRQ